MEFLHFTRNTYTACERNPLWFQIHTKMHTARHASHTFRRNSCCVLAETRLMSDKPRGQAQPSRSDVESAPLFFSFDERR